MSIIKVALNSYTNKDLFLQVRTLVEYNYTHVRVNVDYEGNKLFKLYTIGFSTKENNEKMANPAICHCDNIRTAKKLAVWIDNHLTAEAYKSILDRDRLVVHNLNCAIRAHCAARDIDIDINISKLPTNLK